MEELQHYLLLSTFLFFPNMTYRRLVEIKKKLLFYFYILCQIRFQQRKKVQSLKKKKKKEKRMVAKTMVTLFMVVLLVSPASNPSLSVEAKPDLDCILKCFQDCASLNDNPFKLKLCRDVCVHFCSHSLTDVIYSRILDCAESMPTSFGSGTKTIEIIFHSFRYNNI